MDGTINDLPKQIALLKEREMYFSASLLEKELQEVLKEQNKEKIK